VNWFSIVLFKLFLTAGPSWARSAAPAPAPQPAVAATSPAAPITIPAGTAIELAVTSPIYADATHVSLEVTVSVVQGNRIVIPAKTEVLGLVETTRWSGRNGERERARLRLDRMLFPDQQMVAISGVVENLPRFPRPRAGLTGQDVALAAILGGFTLFGLTSSVAPLIVGIVGGSTGGIVTARATRNGSVWLRKGKSFSMVLELPLTFAPRTLP